MFSTNLPAGGLSDHSLPSLAALMACLGGVLFLVGMEGLTTTVSPSGVPANRPPAGDEAMLAQEVPAHAQGVGPSNSMAHSQRLSRGVAWATTRVDRLAAALYGPPERPGHRAGPHGVAVHEDGGARIYLERIAALHWLEPWHLAIRDWEQASGDATVEASRATAAARSE